MVDVDKSAPLFDLPDKEGNRVALENYRGKWVVIYFYPRDNTPGCTTEAKDFTLHIKDFEALDMPVMGISPDPPEKHKKFIEKHNLKVLLLSDEDHKVMDLYEVWQLKKMYGKEKPGVVRTTFIINPGGKVAFIWKKVKVKGHVEAVKTKLGELAGLYKE